MWSVQIYDSFDSSTNTYWFDEPLPIRLSYYQMFRLMTERSLVVETSVDGCSCHLYIKLVFENIK